MTSLPPSPDTAPTFADIQIAADRLLGVAVRTPLLESPLLNDRVGRRVLVKPECLQVTGSFKFRGASNRVRALTEDEKRGGVVAYSSGNHAQGVAAAARNAGVPALIVMPSDAPAIKHANTAAWGAEIYSYDRFTEDRAGIAARIAAERGAVLIPPYDDPYVIAGQGTVSVEISQQLAEMMIEPSAVVVPCGGGGLISGTALALSELNSDLPVYGVEPASFDDTARSLKSGKHETVSEDARTICDALMSKTPGEITFPINQALLAGVMTVTDDEVLAAMKAAFLDMKLVVEPGGAVALAAILSGKLFAGDGPVVAVLSGGNVDPELFKQAIA